MTLLPFSTFNLVPNGSAEELAQLCQGPGGLFSWKFVVLFKQRFAPQTWRYLEMRKAADAGAWSAFLRLHHVSRSLQNGCHPQRMFQRCLENFEALQIALTISRRLCQLGNAIRSLATCAEPSGLTQLQSFRVTKYDHLQFMCGCHMSRNTWLYQLGSCWLFLPVVNRGSGSLGFCHQPGAAQMNFGAVWRPSLRSQMRIAANWCCTSLDLSLEKHSVAPRCCQHQPKKSAACK